MSSSAQDAGPAQDMGELLESMEPMKPVRRGDVIEGVVMRADADGIFVNIGHKAEGVVPPGEMRSLQPEQREQINVGDDILTFVVRPETAEHAAILSIDRAHAVKAWWSLEKTMEAGDRVEGKILGFNRGGAIVEVEGIRGFVPMSQLVSVSREAFREAQVRRDAAEATAQEGGDAVEATAQEGGDAVEATAQEGGDAVEATAQEGGDAVEATAQEGGDAVEATAQEGGDAVEATAQEGGDAAEATAQEGGDAAEATAQEGGDAAETTAQEGGDAAEATAQEGGDTVEATAQEGGDAVEATGEDEKEKEQSDRGDPLADVIGKPLPLKVLEVDRGRNRAIFSERQAVHSLRDEQKARLIEELTEGEVRRGKVSGISSFGAFVDIGGADGLIHISELSWNTVNSPEEVVRIGEELDVYVLRVDAENRKIALSLRRLHPEPWETINERFSVDDIVDATVTKLTNFGAFARVEGSVEGLIHLSELTSRAINHPREVVREGDEVRLKILRIEPERRRLGLSLKQAGEDLD